MKPTVRLEGKLAANQTSFTTEAVPTLAADTLVLLFVTNAERSGGAARTEPNVTGANLTWKVVESTTCGANDNRRLTCLSAFGLESTGPLTIDFGAEVQSFCAWTAVGYDGVDISGPAFGIAHHQSAAGTDIDILSVDMPDSEAAASNAVAAAIALSDDPGPLQINDPVTNVGLIGVQGATSGAAPILVTYSGSAMVTSKLWEWETKVDAAAIAIEILADPTDVLHAKLARLAGTFEPILRLHDDERWLPVSAITFGSAANAWHFPDPNSAQDDCENWEGAKGLPFPRVPQPPSAFVPGPDWFLELGGWMLDDSNMTSVPGVTGPGEYPYANDTEILVRTGGVGQSGTGAFVGASPWYHFEFFNTSQLEVLALPGMGEQDPVTGPLPNTNPDLSEIVASIPNAMLLCYYFFFPYHEQTCSSATGATCGTVQSRMLASHAGDWQCLAILLGGPGDFPTTTADPIPPTLPPPVFIGLTGLRPERDDIGGGHLDYPPNSFDNENRIVMKVDRYSSQMTVNLDGHDKPVVYVANGTHSLYVDSGAHPTDPFLDGTQPQTCGKYDDPAAASTDGGSSAAGPAADLRFLALTAKIFLVPFGFLWCAGELGLFDNGTNIGDSGRTNVNGPDPVTSDSDQTADGGMVIAPGWMTQNAFGRELAQSLNVDEKRLLPWAGEPLPGASAFEEVANPDMIVDRSRQAWWPVEDNPRYPGTFNGHWGQCVTTDPYGRRAGPRFPPFWRMFLLALEDGRTKGIFS